MAEELGYAVLPVIPSLRGASGVITREMAAESRVAGMTAGRTLGTTMTATAAKSTRPASIFAELEKGAAVSGSGYGKRFGMAMHETIGEYAKSVGAMMVGFMAFEKVKDVLSDTIEEGREAARQQRLTESAIRATGGAAGVTADHVDELAKRLGEMDGVDDDTIRSAENLMLTFRNIKAEGGVFDDATKSAVDMAAQLAAASGGTMNLRSSVTLLGKALNDPVKGLTAMQRVGVAFTDQQKDQIKTLVASGRLMDAQKVVLKELESEYGGAAAALADPMQRAQVRVQQLEEEIGQKLIPTLGTLANIGATGATGLIKGIDAIPGPLKIATAGWLAYTAAQKLGITSAAADGLGRIATGTLAVRSQTLLATQAYRQAAAAEVEAARGGTLLQQSMAEARGDVKGVAAATRTMGITLGRVTKGAALLGAIAVASTGVADRFDLTNTATLGLAGSMLGPLGGAVGATAGLFLDANHAAGSMSSTFHALATSGDIQELGDNYLKLKGKVDDLTHTKAGGWGDAWHDTITELGVGFKQIFSGGPSMGDMQKQLDSARDKLSGLTGDSYTAAAATGVFGRSEQEAAKKLEAANKAGGQATAQIMDISAAAKEAKGSVSAFESQLERQTKAVVQFGNNAYIASQRGVKEGLIKQLATLGPQGAAILSKLAHGSKSDIASMNSDFRSWTNASKNATARVGAALAGVTHPTWNVKLGVTGTTNVERAIAAIDSSIKRATSSLNVFNFSADHVHHPKTGSGGSKRVASPRTFAPTTTNQGEFAAVDAPLMRSMAADFTSRRAAPRRRFSSKGLTSSELGSASRAFDLQGSMTVKQLNAEFATFARTIRHDGGRVGKNFDALRTKGDGLVAAYGRQSKALGRATDALKATQQLADSLKSSVGDFLASNPFDTSSRNVWGSSSTTGVFGILQGDSANATQFVKLAGQLKKNGLSGNALASIESSGIAAMTQMVGLGKAGDQQYQKLFDQRATDILAAQKEAVQTTYGPLFQQQQATVTAIKAQQKALDKRMQKIETAVQDGAQTVARALNHSAATAGRKGRGK